MRKVYLLTVVALLGAVGLDFLAKIPTIELGEKIYFQQYDKVDGRINANVVWPKKIWNGNYLTCNYHSGGSFQVVKKSFYRVELIYMKIDPEPQVPGKKQYTDIYYNGDTVTVWYPDYAKMREQIVTVHKQG